MKVRDRRGGRASACGTPGCSPAGLCQPGRPERHGTARARRSEEKEQEEEGRERGGGEDKEPARGHVDMDKWRPLARLLRLKCLFDAFDFVDAAVAR